MGLNGKTKNKAEDTDGDEPDEVKGDRAGGDQAKKRCSDQARQTTAIKPGKAKGGSPRKAVPQDNGYKFEGL